MIESTFFDFGMIDLGKVRMFNVCYLVHQMQILDHSCFVIYISLLVIDYVFVGRLFQSIDVYSTQKHVFSLIEKLDLVYDAFACR